MKTDKVFTDLEAAIVLIVLIVVAAVISYVMLDARFFATQEVTYIDMKPTTSNVVFEGIMYGNVSDEGRLTGFTFSIKVARDGMAVDMSNTTFIYTSTNKVRPLAVEVDPDYQPLTAKIVYPECPEEGADDVPPQAIAYFPVDKTDPAGTNGNPVLFPGDSAIYTVCLAEKNGGLSSEEWFSLEMIPPIGASTLLTKPQGAG